MHIGYIGLGAMGGAVARRLVGRHDLTVLDLNPASVARLVAQGARAAANPAEIGRACEAVFLCLPRSSDVAHVLFGPEGLVGPGSRVRLVIDQTSGIPSQTHGFARDLATRGVGLVDAPVAGGVPAALKGAVTIMVSGARVHREAALPLLLEISPKVYACGERVGAAQAAKLINNSINSGYRIATLEIAALAAKLGLGLGAVNDVLTHSGANNFTALRLFAALLNDQPSTDFALSLMLKDVTQAIALGFEARAPMPIAGIVRGLMQIGVNATPPGASLDRIVDVVEDMAGAKLKGPADSPAPEPSRLREGFAITGDKAPAAALPRLDSDWRSQADPPGVVVEFSRRSVSDWRRLAAEAAAKGVALLDATSSDVENVVFLGGSRAAFAACRRQLEAAGLKPLHCGPSGAGEAARLIAGAVAACNRAIVYENAAVGLKTGLDPGEMATVLNEGSGWSAQGQKILGALATGGPTSTTRLDAATEDLRALVSLAIAHGAPLLVATQALALHEAQRNRAAPDATVDALATHYEEAAAMSFAAFARAGG